MPPDWAVDLAEELHKPIRRQFKKRKVVSNGIDQIWAADLVEMKKFEEENKGVKFLLTVIDVFSKFGWIDCKPLPVGKFNWMNEEELEIWEEYVNEEGMGCLWSPGD